MTSRVVFAPLITTIYTYAKNKHECKNHINVTGHVHRAILEMISSRTMATPTVAGIAICKLDRYQALMDLSIDFGGYINAIQPTLNVSRMLPLLQCP